MVYKAFKFYKYKGVGKVVKTLLERLYCLEIYYKK